MGHGSEQLGSDEMPAEALTQFQVFYDAAPGILFCLSVEPNDQFRFISANKAFLATIGLSKDQVIGRLVQEVIPPSSIELVLENYKKAIRTGKVAQWEETSEFPTGKKFGEVRVSPILNRNNVVTNLVGIVHDVTDRKQAEEEREQYFKFFQGSSDLMCIADPNGAFKKTNPAFKETLGYSEAELLAKPFIEFIHPEDKQATLDEMERQIKTGYSKNFENRYLCKDGSIRWLSWRAALDQDAGVTYATARDVTERKQFELVLLKAKQDAEDAAKSRSTFMDIAAHELRNPITALSGMLQLAQRMVKMGQPLSVDILNRLREPTDRLARLVVDLLDISRLERGMLVLRLVRTDITSLILKSIEEFQIVAPNRRFIFAKPDQPIEIDLDPVRVNQVISNLLDNAVKYTPAEGAIEIKLEPRPDTIRVSVIDQGAGISKDQQKSLFGAFSRGQSDAIARTSGLGLGLSVCQGIIRKHGGSIGVFSEEGQGSTFYFELPRSESSR